MKATISNPANTSMTISFTPETEDEAAALKELATRSSRTQQFHFVGFKYMDTTVSFSIQPVSRSD